MDKVTSAVNVVWTDEQIMGLAALCCQAATSAESAAKRFARILKAQTGLACELVQDIWKSEPTGIWHVNIPGYSSAMSFLEDVNVSWEW